MAKVDGSGMSPGWTHTGVFVAYTQAWGPDHAQLFPLHS